MFTYLVQTVNNMYQNVSGKSIENQELIRRVFLLCYNQFVSGWVKDVQTHIVSGKYVTTGRVSNV